MKNPKLELVRFVRPEPNGPEIDFVPTLGLLYVDKGFYCFTLEPSWKKNGLNSCVPDGTYKLVHYVSGKFGRSLLLYKVKRRSGILIHRGNTAQDTTGCILLGSQIGFLKGKYAVLSSTVTVLRFLSLVLPFNGLILKIKTLSQKYGGFKI